jgi:beta-lactamase class A
MKFGSNAFPPTRFCACLFFLLMPACSSRAQQMKLEAAASQIQQVIQKSGADVAIAFRVLDGPEELFLRADESFHAASTMKVPVMIELFRQVREGKLKLEDSLTVKNEFHSIVDGSVYSLDAKDDSDAELYKAVGQKRTLKQLCDVMATASSNLAANLLIEKLGVENIRTGVTRLHADGMNVLRGVEDGKAFEKGLNNTTTARGLFVLMEAIAKNNAVDAESSRQMVEILKRQKFNDRIPAGLPSGTSVAHKTGDITKINHDAAIVYAPRPFILVVLTRGIADQKASSALIAEITRLLYQSIQ